MQEEILLYNRFSISLRKFLESYIYVLNSGPSIKKDITGGTERPFSTLVYIKMHIRQGCNLQQKAWGAVGRSCAWLMRAGKAVGQHQHLFILPGNSKFSHTCIPLQPFPTSLGTQVSPQGGFVVPNLAINVPGCAGARGCAGWDGHIAAEIPKQEEVFSPAKNKLGRFNFASIPRV